MGESTQWPGVSKEFKTNEKYENTTLLPPSAMLLLIGTQASFHLQRLPLRLLFFQGRPQHLGNVTITVWPQGHFTVRFFFPFTPLATLFPR